MEPSSQEQQQASTNDNRQQGKNTATVFITAVLLLLAMFLYATWTSKTRSNTEDLAKSAGLREAEDVPEAFRAAKQAYAAPLGSIDENARQERLRNLVTKFVVTKDEFNGSTRYRHKLFSKYYNMNGTTLRADIVMLVPNDPTFYIDSAYVGDGWIFQRSFTVKVGDQILTGFDDRPKREVNSGEVDELISTFDAHAVLIAEAIAKAEQPVRVRLEGEHYYDYTLREAHRKAIADTLELWKLLGGSSRHWYANSW
jgi:hypothetical protein